jgi:hypothetical protein
VDHAGGPKLAVKFRVFASKACVAQIDLMFFAFVTGLFHIVFRTAAHRRKPLLLFTPTDPHPEQKLQILCPWPVSP